MAAWLRASALFTSSSDAAIAKRLIDAAAAETGRLLKQQSRASNSLIVTTILVAGAGALLPFSPLASTLGFIPLPGPYWPAVLVIILGYCVLAHLIKTWFVRRWGM